MPPRKRARVSRAASEHSSPQPKTPTPVEDDAEEPEEDIMNDPWTDDEEAALFKGLIRWKPTGLHKHFHLLSLHQFLLLNGYIHPANEHTKPASIWRKLQTLYNLDALDEREDARQLEKVEVPAEYRNEDEDGDEEDEESEDDDVYSEAENKITNDEFELTGEEFAQLKWERRLAPDRQRRNESPLLLPELNFAEIPPTRFTPSFSIEPSDAATPASRRSRPRASTASAKSKSASTAATAMRRSARQAGSVADEDEAGKAEDEDEENDDDEDEEMEGEGEEEEGTDDNASTKRSTRSAKVDQPRASERTQTRTRSRR